MSDEVPEINVSAGYTVTGTIDAGRGAVSAIAVTTDGSLLTVTHHGTDSVTLIDTAHGAATLTVTEVDEPNAVASSKNRAYVSSVSVAHDEILAFDTHSERIVATYPVTFGITDLAVSPDGRYVYAGRTGDEGAEVAILDAATGKFTSVGIAATTIGCVRVSPDGSQLYVAANGAFTAQLVTIDVQRNRVAGVVEIGSPIRDIALSPDGALAYVGSCGPDFGTVLDLVDTRNSAIDVTYKIGEAAGTLAQLIVSRSGERAYLVGDEQVTVLSTATCDVLGSIRVGGRPSCAAESPDGTRLYIADYAGTITELEIAPAVVDALTSGEEWTAPRGWAFSDLLKLEPTPA